VAPVGYLETGVIYCDDNLHRLAQFPAESIDLIYLDPPFFSNRQYEVIWGDEAEVRSFEDRWEGGIQVYVGWMRERLREIHRILKPSGSVYLHCDWHASHYLKVMMDDVFGRDRFVNEIVWCYRSGGASQTRFARKHDILLFYGKSADRTFNAQHQPYVMGGIMEDEKGPYQIQKGKRVDFNPEGALMTDWWEIGIVSSVSKERLGYPTQKPEALLERVVRASSNPGDIVLDPFAGCGTALVVAQQLGRQWIGIDISPTAVGLMKRRMQKVGADAVKLVGMPVTEAQLHALKPFEFQNWVIQRMNGTHSARQSHDMGIDGFSFMLHEPIQVKQSTGIGRNVVDNFETAVKRDGKNKGYIVAFSFGKGAYEEVARVKATDGLIIELVTVADLLAGKTDLVTPETGLWGADVPMPEPRSPEARPSVEELIASDSN
jgi:DNA modification methylase